MWIAGGASFRRANRSYAHISRRLYDAWVVRDALGRLVSSKWPYFQEDSGMALSINDEPVPVFSCWNGIAAFRADPFLSEDKRRSSTVPSTSRLPVSESPILDEVISNVPALRFRASSPDECFSSESFLLPYDLRRQFGLNKIFINPRVITAYKWPMFVWHKYILRHWLVRWWMIKMENEAELEAARKIIGSPENIWSWDGGECQPVSLHVVGRLQTLNTKVHSSGIKEHRNGILWLLRPSPGEEGRGKGYPCAGTITGNPHRGRKAFRPSLAPLFDYCKSPVRSMGIKHGMLWDATGYSARKDHPRI